MDLSALQGLLQRHRLEIFSTRAEPIREKPRLQQWLPSVTTQRTPLAVDLTAVPVLLGALDLGPRVMITQPAAQPANMAGRQVFP